jgi:predicted oxidoreductase
VEQGFKAAAVAENRQVASASGFLRGALQWFMGNHKNINSWDELKSGLLSMFGRRDKQSKLRKELDELKQGQGKLAEYIMIFQRLIHQVDGMTERQCFFSSKDYSGRPKPK